jgi:PhnB protein
MTKLNVYFNFPGNTEEVFNFYKSVFGGDFSSVIRYRDMPMEGMDIPEKDMNKILHISLPIGKNDYLMASDSLESLGQKVTTGNNIYISVHPETKEEADKIFKALSSGGMVEMDMADQPWGDYYGSLKDRYGVMWMVSYSYKTEREPLGSHR